MNRGQALLGIQGQSVGNGTLGGARQGVAQGIAIKGSEDALAGQLAGLYGQAYENDSSRYLQKLGMGADMVGAGIAMPFSPAKSTASIYQPFVSSATNKTETAMGAQPPSWQTGLSTGMGIYGKGKEWGWW